GACFSEIKRIEGKQELKYQSSQIRSSSSKRNLFLSNLFGSPVEISDFALEGGGKLSVNLSSSISDLPWSKKGNNTLFSLAASSESITNTIYNLYKINPSAENALNKKTGRVLEDRIRELENRTPENLKLETLDSLSFETRRNLSVLLAQLHPQLV